MPAKKRARRDRLLEDALAARARALDDAGAPWMVIGGVAVIAHGVRRLTTDVDAAVLGNAISIEALLESLAKRGIVARIDGAAAFARESLVLLVRHAPSGVDLDVSLAFTRFEEEALAARAIVAFGAIRAPMATPEDLVVFKAIAARPRDVEDAEALLVLHPEIDVARARGRVADLAALADAPELLAVFDGAVARARCPGSG